MKHFPAQPRRRFLLPFLVLAGFAVSSCGTESPEPATTPVAALRRIREVEYGEVVQR